MLRPALAAAVVLVVALPGAALAQSDAIACREMEDSLVRLRCYDDVTKPKSPNPIAPTFGPTSAMRNWPPLCPASFVRKWERRSRMRELPAPERPCTLQTDTGRYICDKDGCGRP